MARTIFIALTWALLINLSIPMESAWGEPKRGGTLTMAIRKDLTMMNPLVRTMSTDQSIRELIYESLLTLDEKGNLKPRLAESWKISKDGKTYTFHLRKGVKYHNGQEMTARDAKFAMDYHKDQFAGFFIQPDNRTIHGPSNSCDFIEQLLKHIERIFHGG